MSGHETIRVLEVGVDAPVSIKNEGKTLKATDAAAGGEDSANCPPESSKTGQERVQQNPEKACRESSGKWHFICFHLFGLLRPDLVTQSENQKSKDRSHMGQFHKKHRTRLCEALTKFSKGHL